MGFPHSEIAGSKVALHLTDAYRSYATSFIAFFSLGIPHTPLFQNLLSGVPETAYVIWCRPGARRKDRNLSRQGMLCFDSRYSNVRELRAAMKRPRESGWDNEANAWLSPPLVSARLILHMHVGESIHAAVGSVKSLTLNEMPPSGSPGGAETIRYQACT